MHLLSTFLLEEHQTVTQEHNLAQRKRIDYDEIWNVVSVVAAFT